MQMLYRYHNFHYVFSLRNSAQLFQSRDTGGTWEVQVYEVRRFTTRLNCTSHALGSESSYFQEKAVASNSLQVVHVAAASRRDQRIMTTP